MSQWLKQVYQRKEYLKKLIVTLEQELQEVPDGKLRISKNKGIPRYYWIKSSGDTRGKYLTKKENELIRNLAQKDYMKKLYASVTEEYEWLNKYLLKYGELQEEKIYNELNEYRKCLVEPFMISDEIYVQEWENEEYNENPYYPEEKVYSTKKDELVRSKSEVMLADMYYELGIPYRYEAELCLENGKKKYPDFTLLNIAKREVIYHEHLGLMDDEQYRKANLIKLDEYRRNGIYLGKNLIITYEAEGCYFNLRENSEDVSGDFSKGMICADTSFKRNNMCRYKFQKVINSLSKMVDSSKPCAYNINVRSTPVDQVAMVAGTMVRIVDLHS